MDERPSKKELIDMLDEMIKNIESLPLYAMTSPISHYDHVSLLILLSSIFKSELPCDKVESED
jgi:hypothetical protein